MSAAHPAWSISPDQYFNLLVDIYSVLLNKLRGVELQSESPFLSALWSFGNNSHYPELLLCWDINEPISFPSVSPKFNSEPLLVLKQLLSSELAQRGESFVLCFCQLALKKPPFSLEFYKDEFDATPAAWAL